MTVPSIYTLEIMMFAFLVTTDLHFHVLFHVHVLHILEIIVLKRSEGGGKNRNVNTVPGIFYYDLTSVSMEIIYVCQLDTS